MSDQKKDPFEIKDRSILTFREHKRIGSSIDQEDMAKNPDTPQAVLEGKSVKDVQEARRRQGEIVTVVSDEMGLKDGRVAILEIGELNEGNGKVSQEEPVLTGIYDYKTDEINRDPEELSKYKFTDEGKRKYGFEGKVSVRENKG